MKVLMIGTVWPEPTASAAGIRVMELIQLLSGEGWEVNFASTAVKTAKCADLTAMGIHEMPIKLNDESFDVYVKHLQPNVVLYDRFMTEEKFAWRVSEQCETAIHILDTQDLHFLRRARQRAVARKRKADDCELMTEDAIREIAAIYRADMSLIISSYEMILLQDVFHVPPPLLYHLPFMLETEEPFSSVQSFQSRYDFIFIGNFRHAPNWDAVVWLKETLWPLIRERLPEACLNVYGAYAPKKAMALTDEKNGFYVLGFTANSKKVMEQARVCLAPLRFGAGLKGKFIDAMRCGTPIVTTDIGAEGMHDNLPWCGEVGNALEDLVTAAVHMYEDESAWQTAQKNGYQIIREQFDKESLGAALIKKIEALMKDVDINRADNFIGRMLRHHSHKSTMYMSKWIEEKNKPFRMMKKGGPQTQPTKINPTKSKSTQKPVAKTKSAKTKKRKNKVDKDNLKSNIQDLRE